MCVMQSEGLCLGRISPKALHKSTPETGHLGNPSIQTRTEETERGGSCEPAKDFSR